jgi:hypothetical protein
MEIKSAIRPSIESLTGTLLGSGFARKLCKTKLNTLNCVQATHLVACRLFLMFAIWAATVIDFAWWLSMTFTIIPVYRLGRAHLVNLVSIAVCPFLTLGISCGFSPRINNSRKCNGFKSTNKPKEHPKSGKPKTKADKLQNKNWKPAPLDPSKWHLKYDFCSVPNSNMFSSFNDIEWAEKSIIGFNKLLLAGADPNKADQFGNTFLHYLLTKHTGILYDFETPNSRPDWIRQVLDLLFKAQNDSQYPAFTLDLNIKNTK